MSVRFRLEILKLRTRDTFATARSSGDVWRTVFLEVADGGLVGWGEGHPNAYYGEDVESTVVALETWLEARETLLDMEPEDLADHFLGPAAARAALDIALHDLHARRLGRPVGEDLGHRYGLASGPVPLTSFTIGLDALDRMVEKTRAAGGYAILKVKLGTDRDLEIVEAIRAVSDVELRVDANASWTVEETRRKAEALTELGVTLLEQPLPADDLDGYRELRRGRLPVPVFVDESCRNLEDVPRLAGVVDGINIKLSKCGGLADAARMIRAAREHHLGVMVGCFIESSLGITAAATLAPYVDVLDLDGAALLEEDPFVGVTIPGGRLGMPKGVGLGVRRRQGV